MLFRSVDSPPQPSTPRFAANEGVTQFLEPTRCLLEDQPAVEFSDGPVRSSAPRLEEGTPVLEGPPEAIVQALKLIVTVRGNWEALRPEDLPREIDGDSDSSGCMLAVHSSETTGPPSWAGAVVSSTSSDGGSEASFAESEPSEAAEDYAIHLYQSTGKWHDHVELRYQYAQNATHNLLQSGWRAVGWGAYIHPHLPLTVSIVPTGPLTTVEGPTAGWYTGAARLGVPVDGTLSCSHPKPLAPCAAGQESYFSPVWRGMQKQKRSKRSRW